MLGLHVGGSGEENRASRIDEKKPSEVNVLRRLGGLEYAFESRRAVQGLEGSILHFFVLSRPFVCASAGVAFSFDRLLICGFEISESTCPSRGSATSSRRVTFAWFSCALHMDDRLASLAVCCLL